MNQKQFEQMVKGTVLEGIMDVDLTKIVEPDELVLDQDAVIGTLNDLEKCFYALADQKNMVAQEIRSACHDDNEDGIGDCNEYYKAKKQLINVSNLMWSVIKTRLNPDKNMVIRKGFQIETSEEESSGYHDEIPDILTTMLMESILSGGRKDRLGSLLDGLDGIEL